MGFVVESAARTPAGRGVSDDEKLQAPQLMVGFDWSIRAISKVSAYRISAMLR